MISDSQMRAQLVGSWTESCNVQEKFFTENIDKILEMGQVLVRCLLRDNGKVLVCGNGGSAAQAQHFAAELVGRYEMPNRMALPALALTTDTSILTAVGNDMGYDSVFSRQVQALGQGGDILLALSTSGRSPNVLRAAQTAVNKGVNVWALTGQDGGPLHKLASLGLIVRHHNTARIQEVHQIVLHLLCQIVEQAGKVI